jgi:predicted CXXCH cytochrome family protein
MFSRYERIFIALTFAVLAAGATFMMAGAQEGRPPSGKQNEDCTSCHSEYTAPWMNSPHGKAGSDPVFLNDWNNQGRPAACLVCHTTGYDPATATWKSDNVSCVACHEDKSGTHPKTPMSVDRSPDLCGRCHSDTRFGWQAWQGSTHYQRGMNCTTCHDPHSASLKVVNRNDKGETTDPSELCISCHKEASMQFPYTKHHKAGVSCIDCHLKHMESSNQAVHAIPDHSFKASLDTCNTCHSAQMHTTAPALTATDITSTSRPHSTPTVEETPIVNKPAPVSPVGFAGLAGLIGLAGGMVMAPWLEKIYRHEMKPQESEDENHESK